MKNVAPEDRPKVGQLVNDTRKAIEEKMEEVKKELEAKAREAKLKAEVIDVTLPAKKNKVGHKHPNTLALEELERIFVGMGYEVVEGPEVEFDYYNFEALNIPANHPAKDEQDTFYINKNIVLRTQTSSELWRRASHLLELCLREEYSDQIRLMQHIHHLSIRLKVL